jgi:MFS family permease
MTERESRTVWYAVAVAAIGYSVDLFDAFLVSAVRIPSLRDLGVPDAESLAVYIRIFNWQLAGMCVGALLVWGPFADTRGRKKILFGSIVTYGVANLLTAAVQTVPQYEFLRFLAGIGLGGELGAGVTLVSENMARHDRGKGTMVIGFFGMLGVVAAGLMAETSLHWRTLYAIGGAMSFVVLFLRLQVDESRLFTPVQRAAGIGQYFRILRFLLNPFTRPFWKFLACILVGTPVYLLVAVIVAAGPELGQAWGMSSLPSPSTGLIWTYLAIAVGDILCGGLSQVLRSRKTSLLVFLGITGVGLSTFFLVPPDTPAGFYARCVLAGLGVGFWANMVTNAAEQFGTNVRATVTVTVPNFVRAIFVPIASAYLAFKTTYGLIPTLAVLSIGCTLVAIVATSLLEDGFSKDLDYQEDLGDGTASGVRLDAEQVETVKLLGVE